MTIFVFWLVLKFDLQIDVFWKQTFFGLLAVFCLSAMIGRRITRISIQIVPPHKHGAYKG